MNKIKIAILLCICVATLSTQVVSTYAEDGSRSVTVSYTPSEIATLFKMEIEIIGDGSVYDGTQELVGNTTVFDLKYEDKKTFHINPAKGSQLKSIVYDEIDITEQLKNGAITVVQEEYDTKLIIIYEVIETSDEDKPTDDKPAQPDNGNTDSGNKGETSKPNTEAPITGVITNEKKWMMIGMLSGIFVLLLWKKKKEEEESEDKTSD